MFEKFIANNPLNIASQLASHSKEIICLRQESIALFVPDGNVLVSYFAKAGMLSINARAISAEYLYANQCNVPGNDQRANIDPNYIPFAPAVMAELAREGMPTIASVYKATLELTEILSHNLQPFKHGNSDLQHTLGTVLYTRLQMYHPELTLP